MDAVHPVGRQLLVDADLTGSTNAGALPPRLAHDRASLQSLQSLLEQALESDQHSSFSEGTLQEQEEEQELKQLLVMLRNLTASATHASQDTPLQQHPASLTFGHALRTLKEETPYLQFYDTWYVLHAYWAGCASLLFRRAGYLLRVTEVSFSLLLPL
jgi:hypothetical protein